MITPLNTIDVANSPEVNSQVFTQISKLGDLTKLLTTAATSLQTKPGQRDQPQRDLVDEILRLSVSIAERSRNLDDLFAGRPVNLG